ENLVAPGGAGGIGGGGFGGGGGLAGAPIVASSGEWDNLTKSPLDGSRELAHSSSNRFIGRYDTYAYYASPVASAKGAKVGAAGPIQPEANPEAKFADPSQRYYNNGRMGVQ